MKTKSTFITTCCVLAVISSLAQVSKHFPDHQRPWLLKGNIGTNPSVNFIGTRDAKPLIFKVNNQRSGYLDFDGFSQNTAFGYQTLISNVPSDSAGIIGGTGNSAFGYQALNSNISGDLNTAIGRVALFSNISGNINTAIGAFSLTSNTTGAFNTAIGSISLSSNTTGSFNSAIGDYALAGNTTGFFNTAMGTPFTLSLNTEGSENIAIGPVSMDINSTGNANVAVGVFSLASNTTGSNNTALGSHADVITGELNNATAIGAGALVDASNKVRIGNEEITSIGGQVGWTNFSDERIKKDIRENVPGLAFINALRPVTYHFNMAKEDELLGRTAIAAKKISMQELKEIKIPGVKVITGQAVKEIANLKIKDMANEGRNEIEKIQFTGFLAQDVDKAAKNIGYDFSGIDKSGKIMGLRYSDFVVPLVKSVQELSRQNEALQKQINELKAMINTGSKNYVTPGEVSLDQNIPNPFNKTTTIGYTLPRKFSNAQIVITDHQGKMLKQITVSGAGKGIVNINTAALSAGTYNYSLIVDKHVLNTKQMILGK